MKHEIIIQVAEQGTISDFKKREIGTVLKSFAGKRIRFVIERLYNKRSNGQNRFFHGVVIPIVQQGLIDAGWNEAKSFEWTKDFIKIKVLMQETVNTDTGEVLKLPRKTSELTTSEFMDLIADIQFWAAEYLGIIIPDPGSQTDLFND